MYVTFVSRRPVDAAASPRLRCVLTAALTLVCAARAGFAASGCKDALAQFAVCESANAFAIDSMRSRRLEAVSVMQDVATGTLVVFAASQPSRLDVSTQVLPLSLSKVFLAASWWDGKQPDSLSGTTSEKPVNIQEMLVGGSDSAGRQVALALRKAVGTQAVLADFRRYGFNGGDEPFWAEVDPLWKKRLTPQPAYARIETLDDANWSSVLSIGESYMMTTVLQVSRFFQAVGNDGLLCAPVAHRITKSTEPARKAVCIDPRRIVGEAAARQLMAAMIDTVKRGSAKRVANALGDVGWIMAGKTGTGGRAGAPMDAQDGWFAGLVFDRDGKARYTVATFVRQGGLGGGNAAETSARLARFLAGANHPGQIPQ
jgi:membrane peptidoglycan carboxypeptidase